MSLNRFAFASCVLLFGLGPALAEPAKGCANHKGCQQRDYKVGRGVRALLQAAACPGLKFGEISVNAGYRISTANKAAGKCVQVMGVFPAARGTWNVLVHNDGGPDCRDIDVSVFTICVWPGVRPKHEPLK